MKDRGLYAVTVGRVFETGPCPENGHDYHRFEDSDGTVLVVRCLNCGRTPLDELTYRTIAIVPDPEP